MEKVTLPEKTMTVKEVACVLGVTERTVQRHLKAIRIEFDNSVGVQNGISSSINETEVTLIKKKIKTSEHNAIIMPPKLQLDGFLYRDKYNQLCPYAEYLQKGYFEVKEWQQGEKTGIQTLITVEGKQFFISKYKLSAIGIKRRIC